MTTQLKASQQGVTLREALEEIDKADELIASGAVHDAHAHICTAGNLLREVIYQPPAPEQASWKCLVPPCKCDASNFKRCCFSAAPTAEPAAPVAAKPDVFKAMQIDAVPAFPKVQK